jgi:hypothetical protein
MKKKMEKKKLVLAKETVRQLEDRQLAEAAGGTTWWVSCIWNCLPRTLTLEEQNQFGN